MARLMDVADAAAAAISGWFPAGELKRSGVHQGPFTERELERLSSLTPGVHISVLRTEGNENAGGEDWRGEGDGLAEEPPVRLVSPARRDVEAMFMASVVARPRGRGESADRVAEAIAAELLRRVPEERWGLPGVQGATAVVLRNEFDAALAARGMALWTVSWRQEIRLGSPWPEGAAPDALCVSVNDDAHEALEEPA